MIFRGMRKIIQSEKKLQEEKKSKKKPQKMQEEEKKSKKKLQEEEKDGPVVVRLPHPLHSPHRAGETNQKLWQRWEISSLGGAGKSR